MIRLSAVAVAWTTVFTCAHIVWADGLALPDSPAGQCASAYVAAFNSGDVDTFRQFESTRRAAAALKRRSVDDRVALYRELYKQYGRLNPRRIVDSSTDSLVLAADSQHGGLLYLDFAIESSAPHRLVGVRIEGPIDSTRAARYEKPLDDSMRARVIERAAAELERSYVFEEVGKKMAADVRKRLASGQYDALANPYAFARRLTADLRALCHDKHLRVTPRAPIERAAGHAPTGPRAAAADNYGFARAEVLAGNVGYIKFNGFSGTPDAQPTAAAALAFVKETDALIFDVRNNGGGSPNMIVFLSGYLFDEPVHLNSFHNRSEGTVRDTYSAAEVPGQRYGARKPVYVLTSGYTFSAAEEFTYNLKHLGRATIVGETTGGGAHPVTRYSINKYFAMSVPYARAVNPVTQTNWEGVGVKPHVEISSERALDRAHELALSAIKKNKTGAAAASRVP